MEKAQEPSGTKLVASTKPRYGENTMNERVSVQGFSSAIRGAQYVLKCNVKTLVLGLRIARGSNWKGTGSSYLPAIIMLFSTEISKKGVKLFDFHCETLSLLSILNPA
jgi:hypothetical protein